MVIMNPFQAMLQKVTSSRHHDQMLRFAAPLDEHFGINHFWYYSIKNTGEYCFLGTHTKWCEYCFDDKLLANFPVLRHPQIAANGITLMKCSADEGYKNMLQTAWQKFKINFNINLVQKLPNEVIAFGFASRFCDEQADERILNELGLLRHFIKAFREKNSKLFELVNDNRVNLAEHFGARFYEQPKTTTIPHNKDAFLRKIGLSWILCLTPRERDIVELLPNCICCKKIAKRLNLSTRTVENYIATIKSKLSCSSKAELIQKTKAYFDKGCSLF